jgi:hypothetical protein
MLAVASASTAATTSAQVAQLVASAADAPKPRVATIATIIAREMIAERVFFILMFSFQKIIPK